LVRLPELEWLVWRLQRLERTVWQASRQLLGLLLRQRVRHTTP
jgi:hypothetical protein